jgi:hypothetical protein
MSYRDCTYTWSLLRHSFGKSAAETHGHHPVAHRPAQRHAHEQCSRAVVTSMGPQNVDTVLIAGKVMKRNGQLVGVDFGRLARLGDEARNRLYASANVKNTRI